MTTLRNSWKLKDLYSVSLSKSTGHTHGTKLSKISFRLLMFVCGSLKERHRNLCWYIESAHLLGIRRKGVRHCFCYLVSAWTLRKVWTSYLHGPLLCPHWSPVWTKPRARSCCLIWATKGQLRHFKSAARMVLGYFVKWGDRRIL
jgi:hypothetical protein